MRLGEKEALDATLQFFEERFDRLASLEFYQVILSVWHLHANANGNGCLLLGLLLLSSSAKVALTQCFCTFVPRNVG